MPSDYQMALSVFAVHGIVSLMIFSAFNQGVRLFQTNFFSQVLLIFHFDACICLHSRTGSSYINLSHDNSSWTFSDFTPAHISLEFNNSSVPKLQNTKNNTFEYNRGHSVSASHLQRKQASQYRLLLQFYGYS